MVPGRHRISYRQTLLAIQSVVRHTRPMGDEHDIRRCRIWGFGLLFSSLSDSAQMELSSFRHGLYLCIRAYNLYVIKKRKPVPEFSGRNVRGRGAACHRAVRPVLWHSGRHKGKGFNGYYEDIKSELLHIFSPCFCYSSL